ncbi:MAG: methyltransferase domain-containing protein [Actinomycetota bacterium]|nr:methyltransferase domain-containing protein [Actinomycetota bacterium]
MPASAALPAPDSPYWVFYEEVAAAQLAEWLPQEPVRVLDLSGGVSGRNRFVEQTLRAGHEVLHVVPAKRELELTDPSLGERLQTVAADSRRLDWLADDSIGAVLAESRALSFCLATEMTLTDIARVLRPGGRLLLCVDSLLLGLSTLADQGRWAELTDVPLADVVLVPNDDGSITRCFWPEEVESLLREAALTVDWVRPRSVLSSSAVERALANDPSALSPLVAAEISLARERAGESIGIHLVAAARLAS